jgi:Rho-type GTPase-activating protein 1/2
MSGETTRNELRQQMSKELCDTLGNLQQDIARLRVERDMTLAEVEELISAKTYVSLICPLIYPMPLALI